MEKYFVDKRELYLRMTDGYGIATNYNCKNECPYCKGKIINIKETHGCHDGEWTFVHNFDCENGCIIQYTDIIKHNGYTK